MQALPASPVKVSVFPLLKNKPELVKKAREVHQLLRPWMNAEYDDSGSIGKRYARHDGISSLILVTGTALGLPPAIDAKPLYYVSLGRGAL